MGKRYIPEEFKRAGIAVAAVDYRLSPEVEAPAYIEDAARAVAWVFENIEKYGGSADNIYVAGHSAGGYLTMMLALDESYLAKYGVDTNCVKGFIPLTGQTITHTAVREERGLSYEVPLVDQYAPLNCVREGVSPMMLITGDRKLELASRYEENLLFESVMRSFGNDVVLYELEGFDHNSMHSPACRRILQWIEERSADGESAEEE